QRSDSILTGMIYHFTNNAIAVTLVYASNNILTQIDDIQPGIQEELSVMEPEVFLAGLIGVGIIMVFSAVIFIMCFSSFKRSTQDRALKNDLELAKHRVLEGDPSLTQQRNQLRFTNMLPAFIAIGAIVVLLAFEVVAMAVMG